MSLNETGTQGWNKTFNYILQDVLTKPIIIRFPEECLTVWETTATEKMKLLLKK